MLSPLQLRGLAKIPLIDNINTEPSEEFSQVVSLFLPKYELSRGLRFGKLLKIKVLTESFTIFIYENTDFTSLLILFEFSQEPVAVVAISDFTSDAILSLSKFNFSTAGKSFDITFNLVHKLCSLFI